MNIAIIKTGTANLASVAAAFNRLEVKSRIVSIPGELRPDDAVVLPGVGTFAAGMKAIVAGNWQSVLQKRFQTRQPTLAICLGLQLLCRVSAENPGVAGINILPADVQPLPDGVVVPHFGWNKIRSNDKFFGEGYAYYANSFGVFDENSLITAGWQTAVTVHGKPFVAAVKQGAFVACQFHPELSGRFGQSLLSRWLTAARSELKTRQEDATC